MWITVSSVLFCTVLCLIASLFLRMDHIRWMYCKFASYNLLILTSDYSKIKAICYQSHPPPSKKNYVHLTRSRETFHTHLHFYRCNDFTFGEVTQGGPKSRAKCRICRSVSSSFPHLQLGKFILHIRPDHGLWACVYATVVVPRRYAPMMQRVNRIWRSFSLTELDVSRGVLYITLFWRTEKPTGAGAVERGIEPPKKSTKSRLRDERLHKGPLHSEESFFSARQTTITFFRCVFH